MLSKINMENMIILYIFVFSVIIFPLFDILIILIVVIVYYASSDYDWQRSSLNENACFRNVTDYNHNFIMMDDCPDPSIRMATNPMCRTFPRVAACDYHRFGPGGNAAGINALCILALNVINDKVFVLIWWWLVFLALVGKIVLSTDISKIGFSKIYVIIVTTPIKNFYN